MSENFILNYNIIFLSSSLINKINIQFKNLGCRFFLFVCRLTVLTIKKDKKKEGREKNQKIKIIIKSLRNRDLIFFLSDMCENRLIIRSH